MNHIEVFYVIYRIGNPQNKKRFLERKKGDKAP